MSISGSADVAALAHYHKKAVFIGEETGGAYFGNSSGDFLNLTLPVTRIRLRIPIRGSMLSVSDYPYLDRGVLPDYSIELKIEDLLKGVDTELNFAIDIINKQTGKK